MSSPTTEDHSITRGLEDMKLMSDDERKVFYQTKDALRKYGALIVPSLLVARLFCAYAASTTQDNVHLPKTTEQYLSYIASDLALLLARVKREDTERLAVSPDQVKTPTVAEIASRCSALVSSSNSNEPNSNVCATLCGSFYVSESPVADGHQFKIFLKKALKYIQKAAISAVEAHSDFEYLWYSCMAYGVYRKALEGIPCNISDSKVDATVVQRDRQLLLQDFAWKLSCLASKNNDGHRRQHAVTVSACMGLLCFLSECFTEHKKNDDTRSSDYPTRADAVDDQTTPEAVRVLPAGEQDAIDALKMICVCAGTTTSDVENAPASSTGDTVNVDDAIALIVRTAVTLNSFFETRREREDKKDESEWCKQVLKEIVVLATQLVDLFVRDGGLSEDLAALHGQVEATEAVESRKVKSILSKLLVLDKKDELKNLNIIVNLLTTKLKNLEQNTTLDSFDTLGRFPLIDQAYLNGDFQKINMADLCRRDRAAGSHLSALVLPYNVASDAILALSSVRRSNAPASTDILELNEWTVTITSFTKVKPSPRLMLYLDASIDSAKRRKLGPEAKYIDSSVGWRSVLMPVLNRATRIILSLHASEDGENQNSNEPSTAQKPPAVKFDTQTGEYTFPSQMNDQTRFLVANMALYYHALESILFQETARLKSASHPKLVLNEQVHLAILACCYICVVKSIQSSSAPVLSDRYSRLDILQTLNVSPYTFLKVSESFSRALSAKKTGPISVLDGFPRLLQKKLSECDVTIIDSVLWSNGASESMYSVRHVVAELKRHGNKTQGRSIWPPPTLRPLPEETNGRTRIDAHFTAEQTPDERFFSYVLLKLLRISFFRISAFCKALDVPPQYAVAKQTWLAFRYLLRNNIELLYNRHIDQLILCCLYGVCKIMKYQPEIKFSRIIEVYTQVRGVDLGERASHMIVRDVSLLSPKQEAALAGDDDTAENKRGNVIQLYNRVFVPAMRLHLLQSESLREACKEYERLWTAKQNAEPDATDSVSPPALDSIAARSGVVIRHFPNDIEFKEDNVKFYLRSPKPPMEVTIIKAPSGTKSKVKITPTAPKHRMFYSFGEAATTNMNRLNDMVSQRSVSPHQVLKSFDDVNWLLLELY